MGASEARSQVLPPAWRFTNWEQWSRCTLSHSRLSGGVCFFCALCSLSLKEPWGLELRYTCSAWLLSYGCCCQSLSLSHPGILRVLGLVGIFAFLSLLHLQAPARYLIPLPMHLKHQRCCWWTHLSSSLVTGFLIWVIIRLYHDTYAVNSFYGYHFVLIKGMTLCPPYLLGFVFGVWPHKKSQL